VKCQVCSSPATVHLTDIVDGQKRVRHLCQKCAEGQQLVKQDEINLPAILQALIGQHVGPLSDELSRLKCPACGIRYMEFRTRAVWAARTTTTSSAPASNRCSSASIARRPTKASPRRRRPPTAPRHAEVIELRRRLRQAVEAEAYEEAARIRDLLRTKEATDESG
jgi:protein arginine kinase activator